MIKGYFIIYCIKLHNIDIHIPKIYIFFALKQIQTKQIKLETIIH